MQKTERERDDKACYVGDHVWIRRHRSESDKVGSFALNLAPEDHPDPATAEVSVIHFQPEIWDAVNDWLDRWRNDPEIMEEERMARAEARADAMKEEAATTSDVPRGTLDMS